MFVLGRDDIVAASGSSDRENEERKGRKGAFRFPPYMACAMGLGDRRRVKPTLFLRSLRHRSLLFHNNMTTLVQAAMPQQKRKENPQAKAEEEEEKRENVDVSPGIKHARLNPGTIARGTRRILVTGTVGVHTQSESRFFQTCLLLCRPSLTRACGSAYVFALLHNNTHRPNPTLAHR